MGIRVTILLIFITAIVTGVGYKIYSLNSVIEDQKIIISDITNEKKALELKLTVEKSNTVRLKENIEYTNKELELLASKNKNLAVEFEEWKKRPPEIKYKTKVIKEIITNTEYVNGNCEDGLELNRKISEMKYEDL